MKTFKSVIGTILIGNMVLLTACSSSGDNNSPNVEKEGNKAERITTINAAVQRHSAVDALKLLLPEFEQQTGIKVNLEVLPQEEQESKVELALASRSDQYDLFLLDHMYTPQYAKAGWIEDLSPYITANEAELDMQDFMKGYLDALSYDNKVYALPFYGESTMLMYNKEMFSRAGITNPPTTLSELKQAAAQLTQDGQYGIAMRGQRGAGMNIYIWAGFYNAYGGQWLKDGKPDLASEAAVEATKLYAELITEYAPPGGANFSWDQVQLAMQQGTVAMAIDATNFAVRLENEENSKVVGKIGYAAIPSGPDGSSPSAATRGFAIPKGSNNKDAAFEFIKWALSKEIQLKTSLDGERADATRISIWNSGEFKEKYNYDQGKWIEVSVQSMNEADPEYRPRIEPWKQMGDRLGIAVSAVLAGADVEATLSKAQEEIDKYFK